MLYPILELILNELRESARNVIMSSSKTRMSMTHLRNTVYVCCCYANLCRLCDISKVNYMNGVVCV